MGRIVDDASRVQFVENPTGLIIAACSYGAVAQKQYDIGVSYTEIKIGNVLPYSGPASAYAAIGKVVAG
jgi:branched-chain amino acid transport system substrate-binding protein